MDIFELECYLKYVEIVVNFKNNIVTPPSSTMLAKSVTSVTVCPDATLPLRLVRKPMSTSNTKISRNAQKPIIPTSMAQKVERPLIALDESFWKDKMHRAKAEPPAAKNKREVRNRTVVNTLRQIARSLANATVAIPPTMDKARSVVLSIPTGKSAFLIKTLRATTRVVSLCIDRT